MEKNAKSIHSVQSYLDQLNEIQKPIVLKIREAIIASLDKNFEECIQYGMIGYVVPKSIYPEGYHCDKTQSLPFAGLAAQTNSISLYHMGVYANPDLLDWFQKEYKKTCRYKLDMGKSCIRFKKYEDIPYELITELFAKLSVSDWINQYESVVKK